MGPTLFMYVLEDVLTNCLQLGSLPPVAVRLSLIMSSPSSTCSDSHTSTTSSMLSPYSTYPSGTDGAIIQGFCYPQSVCSGAHRPQPWTHCLLSTLMFRHYRELSRVAITKPPHHKALKRGHTYIHMYSGITLAATSLLMAIHSRTLTLLSMCDMRLCQTQSSPYTSLGWAWHCAIQCVSLLFRSNGPRGPSSFFLPKEDGNGMVFILTH